MLEGRIHLMHITDVAFTEMLLIWHCHNSNDNFKCLNFRKTPC